MTTPGIEREVLNFRDIKVVRDGIEIEVGSGVEYDIKGPEDLSLEDLSVLANLADEFEEIQNLANTLTDDDVHGAGELLRRTEQNLVRQLEAIFVDDVPREILVKIPQRRMQQYLSFFDSRYQMRSDTSLKPLTTRQRTRKRSTGQQP